MSNAFIAAPYNHTNLCYAFQVNILSRIIFFRYW